MPGSTDAGSSEYASPSITSAANCEYCVERDCVLDCVRVRDVLDDVPHVAGIDEDVIQH
jgi:hypothetical protein